MKPGKFDYFDPTTIAEAASLIQQYGFDAKILAGGQSLVPLLNFRLATPQVLVDINRIGELNYVKEKNGMLAFGATARQRVLEVSDLVRSRCGLLTDTAPYVGHPQIRNRGTVAGSICHADPGAELPAVARALDAQMRVVGPSGERVIKAEDFFVTLMTTCMEPEEFLVEVLFPTLPERTGWAIEEFAIRHGDFAIAGVTAVVTLDEKQACKDVRIGAIGVAEVPHRDSEVEKMFHGQKISDALLDEASEKMAAGVDPSSDLHASAAQRRHLLRTLTRKAVKNAAAMALKTKKGK